jgi:hypothetical protein
MEKEGVKGSKEQEEKMVTDETKKPKDEKKGPK